MAIVQLKLLGISCGSCINKINKALSGANGITALEINPAEETALVETELQPISIINLIRDAGYDAQEI